jgi:hypothetical protein
MKKSRKRKKISPKTHPGGRPRFEEGRSAKILGGFSVPESMFKEWNAYRDMLNFDNDSAFFRHIFATWRDKVQELIPKPEI